MVEWDDGNGSALYLGGDEIVGEGDANMIVRWDGKQFSNLDGGLTGKINGLRKVRTLAVGEAVGLALRDPAACVVLEARAP